MDIYSPGKEVRMDIELLISTMNADKSLLDKINIHSNVVVVNQCGYDGVEESTYNGHHVKWINSSTKGLSRSRNIALKNATADIVVLTDDDVEYVAGYPDIIEKAFLSHPEMDIISFQVEGINGKFKDYSEKENSLNFLGSMKVSSVEIAIKRKKIEKAKIQFNEAFGSGAKYRMGEENIFLFNCLKKKLKLYYLPQIIANLWVGDSTWFQGFNKKYFIDRGATYYEMFGCLAPLMILQFIIRKRKLIQDISLSQALKCAFEGMNDWRKLKNTI